MKRKIVEISSVKSLRKPTTNKLHVSIMFEFGVEKLQTFCPKDRHGNVNVIVMNAALIRPKRENGVGTC